MASLAEARDAGGIYYFTGKPCKNGHIAERSVASRGCIKCLRKRNKLWMKADRAENRDHYLAVERKSRALARERLGEVGVHLRSKSYNLWHKYGIRLEDYERMLEAQGGVCAICAEPPAKTRKNKGYLDVDHDHSSGATRGLLCHRCNQGMIAVDNFPGFPEKAAVYASKYRRN